MGTANMNQQCLDTTKPRDLSIDYLRTTITLMVIAHHSALAYTTWARFDSHDVFGSSAPGESEGRNPAGQETNNAGSLQGMAHGAGGHSV